MDHSERSSPRAQFPIRENVIGKVAFAPIRKCAIAKPKTSAVEGSFLSARYASIGAKCHDFSDLNRHNASKRDLAQHMATWPRKIRDEDPISFHIIPLATIG
jgi:hypothetical protein